MALSNELISEFVKITNDKPAETKETILYGTVDSVDREEDGVTYVTFDGAEISTPVDKTVEVKDKDRVVVMIKNHTATVTGNLSDPGVTVTRATIIEENISKSVTTDMLDAEVAKIDELIATKADIEDLEAEAAKIKDLQADNVTIKGTLEANEGRFTDLETTKLDASVADITYANIDFTNITKAAMEYFYSSSGLIDNVVVGDGTITGNLIGVTIKGDTIEGGTVVADKLVIQGEDGLYYKLNTDGVTTESEQTEYNSLNGSVITAKSLTATQISVDDLVAFDATIGGFNITDTSIYSEVKDSEGNTTRGIYMDTDGQINIGDESNFIKYYKDEDGSYRLAISAASILYALDGKQHSIADLGLLGDYVRVSTYEGEPCVEWGESDSDFKLIITNTRIMFMEGSSMPAYISNQSLYITKAVVEEELQQGDFIWKVRSNGNMGLMWKGVDE